MTVGQTGRTAVNLVGAGTSTKTFQYVVQTGDTDDDGIQIFSPLVPNDATVQDTSGNDAVLTFVPPDTSGVFIDTTAPTIAIGPASVTNTLNGPVSWTVTYSDTNFNASTLANGDIVLNASPGIHVGTIQITGVGNTRTVTLDAITGFGTLGLSINAGTASDLAGNLASEAGPSATVQVNAPPTITGTLANQAVNDNATILPFANVTIGDVDVPAQTLSVTFTLDDPAKATITTLNGFTDAGGGLFTFNGTGTEATSALQGVVFTPIANRLPVGGTETLNIALTATDNFSPVTTDNTTSVVITSVNDAPANVQISASAATIAESVPVTLNGTFDDPDTRDDPHLVSIDWGDGTAPSVVPVGYGIFVFKVSHTYLNNPPQDSFTITATVIDAANATASAQLTLNTLPAFLSDPTANPNPAIVDLAVAFTVAPAPADALVTWNFGDGSADATGANAAHIYAAAGTYIVTVSAQNPRTGTTTSATLTLDVGNGTVIPNTLPMQLARGIIRFGPTADHVRLVSQFQADAEQTAGGKTVSVAVNGLSRTFTFDSHGNVVAGDSRARLYIRKNGIARFTLLVGGQLKASLTQGVTLDAVGNPKKAAVTIALGTKVYSAVKPVTFRKLVGRFGFGK
jgi:hypothetical protein